MRFRIFPIAAGVMLGLVTLSSIPPAASPAIETAGGTVEAPR